jgi:Na+/glutamate symporter
MALGATPMSILRLIVSSGLRVVLFSATVGIVAALIAGRVVASLLFATSRTTKSFFLARHSHAARLRSWPVSFRHGGRVVSIPL